jgi:hypothetical protein
MRGIYVLDLDNGNILINISDSIQDAELQAAVLLRKYESSANFDGSYHYYPILKNEQESAAEKRIYIMIAKKYGLNCIMARSELLESIGKGTWGPDMEIRRILNVASSGSFQPSSIENEKEQFPISI